MSFSECSNYFIIYLIFQIEKEKPDWALPMLWAACEEPPSRCSFRHRTWIRPACMGCRGHVWDSPLTKEDTRPVSSSAHSVGWQLADDRCLRGGGRVTQGLGLCRDGVPGLQRGQRQEVTKASSTDFPRSEWGPTALICTGGETESQRPERTWSKSCGRFLGPGPSR